MTDMQRYYRNLAALKSADARALAAKQPRASVRGSTGFAGRPVKNAVSGNSGKLGINRAGTGKITRPAILSGTRFAHWIGDPVAASERSHEAPAPIATTRGDAASFATADAAAQFVLQAGGKAFSPAKPRALVKPDMNSPGGVAAFILSAGRGAIR